MTEFDEMVAFLFEEAVGIIDLDTNTTRYTLKARFGLTKDFYVDFDKKKCSMWHQELKGLDMAVIHSFNLKDSDFKTHVQIQQELDRIL